MQHRQRGQVTWEVVAAGIGAIGGAVAIIGYLAGPMRWSGDVDARLRGVERAVERVDGKIDSLTNHLIQRGSIR